MLTADLDVSVKPERIFLTNFVFQYSIHYTQIEEYQTYLSDSQKYNIFAYPLSGRNFSAAICHFIITLCPEADLFES